MAVFLLLLAIVGGVVVADVVLENTTVAEVTMFNQPVTGYSEGWLLAMAAGLGFVVAVLLVASVSSTKTRRARRKRLRSMNLGVEGQGVGPEREHASWLDESFGRDETAAELGELARPTDLGRGHRTDSPDDHPTTLAPEPAEHPSEPLYEQTRQAARLRNNPERRFPPDHGRR